MRVFPRVLVYFGIFCLIFAGFLYWQRTNPTRLKFDTEKIESSLSTSSTNVEPRALIIADLGIESDIYPASIKNAKWEATSKGVSYLSSTPVPGEIGNSVIYGHNWKSILGNLVKARPGQTIKILYSDGSRKEFEIKYTQVVTPDQTQILDQTGDNRITLYTCTGFLDSKRFVVTATLSVDPDAAF